MDTSPNSPSGPPTRSFFDRYSILTQFPLYIQLAFLALASGAIIGSSSKAIRNQVFAYGPRHPLSRDRRREREFASDGYSSSNSSLMGTPEKPVTPPLSSSSSVSGSSSPPELKRRKTGSKGKDRDKSKVGSVSETETETSPLPLPPVLRDEETPTSLLFELLKFLASWTVPHSRFIHFYILSFFASLMWGYLVVFPAVFSSADDRGLTVKTMCWLRGKHADGRRGMTAEGLFLTWAFMLFQGARRWVECIVAKRRQKKYEAKHGLRRGQGQSKMPGAHWLAALGFYYLMSIAVWIEAIDCICAHPENFALSGKSVLKAVSQRWIAIPTFVAASVCQSIVHAHLLSLRYPESDAEKLEKQQQDDQDQSLQPRKQTYKLPTHPFFKYTVTPHYLAEVVVYAALSRIATVGKPMMANATILAAFCFVISNLGSTAMGTREWYARTFGRDAVEGKARMIPRIW